MHYLTGVSRDEILELAHPRIGLMAQPRSYSLDTVARWPTFAADNGCFSDRWKADHWLRWLDAVAGLGDRCLFAVVPDVVANHAATLERWHRWHTEISIRGLAAAFAAQNGCTPDDVPPEAAAVFIGGDTSWKLSETAWAIVAATKAHGRWAHMGRVNTWRRFNAALVSGVDSADGTLLKHAPLSRLIGYLDRADRQPHFKLLGGH